jgi:hypothetical protein
VDAFPARCSLLFTVYRFSRESSPIMPRPPRPTSLVKSYRASNPRALRRELIEPVASRIRPAFQRLWRSILRKASGFPISPKRTFFPEAQPQTFGGVASLVLLKSVYGKPKAYRSVLRQSRNCSLLTAHCSLAAA